MRTAAIESLTLPPFSRPSPILTCLQDNMTEYLRRWEAREVAITFNQNATVSYFTQVCLHG